MSERSTEGNVCATDDWSDGFGRESRRDPAMIARRRTLRSGAQLRADGSLGAGVVVAVDGAEAVGIGERGFDFGALGDDVPEGLGNGGDEKKGFAGAGIPAVAMAGEVVGLDGAAAVGRVAETGERREGI